jgi:hypothetical protein
VQTPNSDYLLDAFLPRSADGAALDLCEDFEAVLRRNLCRVGGQSPEKKKIHKIRQVKQRRVRSIFGWVAAKKAYSLDIS